MGELAQNIIELQMKLHEHGLRKQGGAISASRFTSLFDLVAQKLSESLGESDSPEADLKVIRDSLPPNVLERLSVSNWEQLPYATFRRMLEDQKTNSSSRGVKEFEKGSPTTNLIKVDLDGWVLLNERWLRKTQSVRWKHGLMCLSMDAADVFPGSFLKGKSRVLTRHMSSLKGYKFLDKNVAKSIEIQPSVSAFSTRFEQMTGGLLRGLDWNNVCVAGGIALGALLTVEEPRDLGSRGFPACMASHNGSSKSPWADSDIDLYIYGLNATEANGKIADIFNVFRRNLPVEAKTLVVRNSKTITFFSHWPLRRIQIVLKLVKSPREVLLNFDLDICAVCWDGSEVWMLPRACRALETGYTVFTMNLIHGHYLGERRASQEQRVFKYADRGYGIRILHSYMMSLKNSRNNLSKLSTKMNKIDAEDLCIDKVAARAREFTEKAVKHFQMIWGSGKKKIIKHSYLDVRAQKTETIQNRSCLSGLELLMRHVALWEHAKAGNVTIEANFWASTDYGEDGLSPLGYDDTPIYSWNSGFDRRGFKTAMDRFNRAELDNNYRDLDESLVAGTAVRRISYGGTVEKIMRPDRDIIIPVYLDSSFANNANKVLCSILKRHGLAISELPLVPAEYNTDSDWSQDTAETLYLWRISNLTMWQQLDRRLDELYEVLWAFRRANQTIKVAVEDRMDIFRKQVGRRALRTLVRNEADEFARWIGRRPGKPNGYYRYHDGPLLEPEHRREDYDSMEDEDSENDYSDEEDGYRGWF